MVAYQRKVESPLVLSTPTPPPFTVNLTAVYRLSTDLGKSHTIWGISEKIPAERSRSPLHQDGSSFNIAQYLRGSLRNPPSPLTYRGRKTQLHFYSLRWYDYS